MRKNINKIPQNEALFDSTSYVDPNGRVFRWDGHIFRAIDPRQSTFYKELLNKDFFRKLCREQKIVGTGLSSYMLDGYAYLLEHDKVRFRTYCVEWPAIMLKDAALLTLDVALELSSHKLVLQDAYPWNILFKGARPVFIDVGSIVEADARFIWKAYDQFCRFFLYPLYLCNMKKGKVARALLTDYWNGVREDVFLNLIPFSKKVLAPSILSRVTLPYLLNMLLTRFYPAWKNNIQQKPNKIMERLDKSSITGRFLSTLRKEVDSIKILSSPSHWARYYEEKFMSSGDDQKGLDSKTQVISRILDSCRPDTVLDLGANTGHFSFLAAQKGASVVACDTSEACVHNIYNKAKSGSLDITPLVLDFINPTPGFGWCNKQFPSSFERLKCDMVLCLALIHHLIFKQWQNFDRIAETLYSFSNKWVVVEFISKDDEFIKSCWEDRFEFYSLTNLLKALERFFGKIHTYDSYPEGRKIILCEK